MGADRNGSGFSPTPWNRRTRQEEGHHTEAALLKQRGAIQHPRSGAGAIKDDGHDDNYLFEVKDARKSYTLNGRDLRGLFVRAVRQDKTGCMLIFFSDLGFTAEVRLIPGGKELFYAD